MRQTQYDEPPLGAHLVTPRRGYVHHGIYVGNGRVVHYAGLSRCLSRGPVEEVTLARFARGRGYRVKPCFGPRFDTEEIVRRARSRVGEDCYRLLSNNCEHFCQWCLLGQNCSEQVEKLLAWPRFALRAALETVRQFLDWTPRNPSAGACVT